MEDERKKFVESVAVALAIVALMWGIEFYEFFTGKQLYTWGVYPRAWDGILGIFRAPFLHSDWGHIIANSGPVLMLITMMFYFYRRVAISATLIISFLTGFMVWLFAKESYHIGASGVVYGLVAFVFWSGIFRRNPQSIVLSLIILTLFAGYFVGIMPDESKQNISWESHLFGGLVGIFTAFLFKNTIEKGEDSEVSAWAESEETRKHFLPQDIFEKTKYERYLEEMERRRQEEIRLRLLEEQRRQSFMRGDQGEA